MGIEIEEIKPGISEQVPKKGQRVQIHYEGFLQNGAKFDSSRARGLTFTFKLGAREVIRGWDEAVAQMCKGQILKVTLSPDYAYGSTGVPGAIPPNSIVSFFIELLNFF